MSNIEAEALMIYLNEIFKDNWERTRYVAFINAACFSEKITKPTDLLKFEWEQEIDNEEISEEERNIRANQMLEWSAKHQLIKVK